MKADRDFTLMRAVIAAGLAASVALLAAICLLPQLIMGRIADTVSPALISAKEKAHSDKPSDALEDVVYIRETVENSCSELMMLFSHGELFELLRAVRAAEEIAPTDDPAQLLQELTSIETEIELLYGLNTISLENLF